MRKVLVCDHPLVQDKLASLRDKSTPPAAFRSLMAEISMLMGYEVLKGVATSKGSVQTPLKRAPGRKISQPICVAAVLRAGLGMADCLSRIVPQARFGHIGIYRNEANLEPVRYYVRLPADLPESFTILADPMLATAGTAIEAAQILKSGGAKKISLLCLLAAEAGVKRFHKAHPDVPVFTAALDPVLNSSGYIVPGLGDAGDRLFAT